MTFWRRSHENAPPFYLVGSPIERASVSESRETGIWLRRVQKSVTDTRRRRRRGSTGKQLACSSFRSGGYLQVSEEKMMTICSSEQMVEIRRNAVRVTRDEIFQPLMVIDENSSQTDSSDEMETFRPNAEGMIRLEEIPTEPPGGANLTLTIATTDDVNGGRVGSYGKGKGVMMGPDITGVQLFGLQMGSGSGYANTEEANVAIEEDVGYAGEQKVSFPRNG
ncbi:hypothetical protein YC2023_115266 [Brassica napus]